MLALIVLILQQDIPLTLKDYIRKNKLKIKLTQKKAELISDLKKAGEFGTTETSPKKVTPKKATPKKEAPKKEEAKSDAPLFKAPKGEADKLTDIKGIGPVAEGQLNEQGITTFAQIAALSEEEIVKIDEYMPFSADQIKDWQAQAKEKTK